MDKQNITLSIPKDVLQKIKIQAVKQGTSVSALLTHALKEIVAGEESYLAAQHRHKALLNEGWDLGTEGTIGWTREEIQDRGS